MPVLLGTERKWRMVQGHQKLEEVKLYGYVTDFFVKYKGR